MTDETGNMVQELLRGLRAKAADFREELNKRFTGIETRLGAIEDRLDAIDTQLEGWRYVFVATTGSPVTDMKDHETRIAVLEGLPA